MNELALFAGAGGGILGGRLVGWRTVCAVEVDSYCRKVLLARQREGHLDRFPIWDDVKTFDGKPWRGFVDVVSGGFPCQDISLAGRREGIGGSRSSLWFSMARIISEVRPRYVFVENSPNLINRGLTDVLGTLAAMGYNARWGIIGARHAGSLHKRDRIWVVATDADDPRRRAKPITREEGEDKAQLRNDGKPESMAGRRSGPWAVKSGVGRVANGVADRVDRIRAIGNGQVPAVARQAWRTLSDCE